MRSRLVLFSIVAVFLILGAAFTAGFFMPRQWSVTASTTIQAAPSAVDPFLHAPRRWPEWFPWSKVKAPDIVYSYAGPEIGVGAVLRWTSTHLGQGELTLTRADPGQGVGYTLVINGFAEFPIRGEIALAEANGVTTLTMKEGGDMGTNPIARLFRGVTEANLKFNLDGALERLQALAEGRPPPVEAPPR